MHFITVQATNLSLRWKTYLEISASGSERVELLNQSAGTFFAVVQRSLFDDCIMAVCRLTDPAKSSGKSNLSLFHLINTLEDGELKNEVSSLVDQAKKAASFQRNHRDKRIAHSDLELITNDSAMPQIEPATAEKMNYAIEAIWEPVRKIEASLGDTHLITELAPISRGAVSLLNCLYRGQLYMEKLESSEFDTVEEFISAREEINKDWLLHGYKPRE